MEFDKNATTVDIAKMHAKLVEKYVNGHELIHNLNDIVDLGSKITAAAVFKLFGKINVLDQKIQFEVIEEVEKIISLTYLVAVAEVIDKKEQHKNKIISNKTTYSVNGAKDSRTENIIIVHNQNHSQ